MNFSLADGDRVLAYTARPASIDPEFSTPVTPTPEILQLNRDNLQTVSGDLYTGVRWVQTGPTEFTLPAGWYFARISAQQAEHFSSLPPLIIFDVDSTLIHEEVIELLARHAGKEAEVADVTERAMRGEIDFAESLRARVKTLAGLPVTVIDDVVQLVHVRHGARDLITSIRERGGHACAVSGGFTEVLSHHADQLGLADYRANVLAVRDGRLTGLVTGEIVDRDYKARILAAWRAEFSLSVAPPVIAMGDGANDIAMAQAADLSVGLCPKPALREVVNISLDVADMGIVKDLLDY